MESSIWVPIDRGSTATLTPVPNIPVEETPTQLFKINPKNFYGKEKRELTHKELLNRDYYRGRFCAKS